ncbi:MAG: agmatinase [PVC group bacterium]
MEKTVSYLSGTAAGPGRILAASRQVELYDPELAASPYRAGIHTCPPVDCAGGLEDCLEAVRETVYSVAGTGKMPVCLGGEHSLTLGAVRALKEINPGFSVLHLDAHADLRDRYGGTPLSHACVMRRVCELGLPLVSVGVRSLSEEEADYSAAAGVRLYPGWEHIDREYPWPEIAGALADRVYISVDMDVFDPAEVPGVGTPEPGGLRWDQALELFRALADAGKSVVGIDLVELCPQKDSIISDFFTARLLYKMIGYFSAA